MTAVLKGLITYLNSWIFFRRAFQQKSGWNIPGVPYTGIYYRYCCVCHPTMCSMSFNVDHKKKHSPREPCCASLVPSATFFGRKFDLLQPDTLSCDVLIYPLTMGSRAASRSCLLYTSPSPRDQRGSRMPSSA